jgi:hypothetical protein
MYLYEIKYKDNTTEYVEATDVQNACAIANCRMDNVVSVMIMHEVEEEHKSNVKMVN